MNKTVLIVATLLLTVTFTSTADAGRWGRPTGGQRRRPSTWQPVRRPGTYPAAHPRWARLGTYPRTEAPRDRQVKPPSAPGRTIKDDSRDKKKTATGIQRGSKSRAARDPKKLQNKKKAQRSAMDPKNMSQGGSGDSGGAGNSGGSGDSGGSRGSGSGDSGSSGGSGDSGGSGGSALQRSREDPDSAEAPEPSRSEQAGRKKASKDDSKES
jgi:hypothetical protein